MCSSSTHELLWCLIGTGVLSMTGCRGFGVSWSASGPRRALGTCIQADTKLEKFEPYTKPPVEQVQRLGNRTATGRPHALAVLETAPWNRQRSSSFVATSVVGEAGVLYFLHLPVAVDALPVATAYGHPKLRKVIL